MRRARSRRLFRGWVLATGSLLASSVATTFEGCSPFSSSSSSGPDNGGEAGVGVGADTGTTGSPPGDGAETGAGVGLDGAPLPLDGASPIVIPSSPAFDPCAPMPSLCGRPVITVRFDTGISGGFGAFATQGGSAVSFEEGGCAPKGVRTTAKAPGGTTSSSSGFVRRLFSSALATTTKIHVHTKLRGPALVAGAVVNYGCGIFLVSTTAGGHVTEARFKLDDSGKYKLDGQTLRADGTEIDDPSGVTFSPNAVATAWEDEDLIVVVDLAQSLVAMAGTYGGVSVTGPNVKLDPINPPNSVEVRCGALFADHAAATHVVDIDDVQIDLCP